MTTYGPAATRARAVGKNFDIVSALVPKDLETGAQTGNRIHLKNCRGVTVVLYAAAGTANDDLQFSIQECNAKTGGTAQDLPIITDIYTKDGTTITAATKWAKVSQSVAAAVTDTGGAGTSAEHQQLVFVDIGAEQLSDGFEWIQVLIPDLGSAGAKLGCAFYIPWGLKQQRSPENIPDWNA